MASGSSSTGRRVEHYRLGPGAATGGGRPCRTAESRGGSLEAGVAPGALGLWRVFFLNEPAALLRPMRP